MSRSPGATFGSAKLAAGRGRMSAHTSLASASAASSITATGAAKRSCANTDRPAAVAILKFGAISSLFPPTRFVSLTEETVETLYLLGEQDRIAGISLRGPPAAGAPRQAARASAFTSAGMPKILALEPDLVLAFSDLQAYIVADLIRRGIAVHAFNQRTVAGILDTIRMLGTIGRGQRTQRTACQRSRRTR